VLFADVVHSMDIAAAVGAERLREIMAELADRCAAVVQRYGGAVDKFTGDGIMAVFGAPVALEDHAIRACRGGLGHSGGSEGARRRGPRSRRYRPIGASGPELRPGDRGEIGSGALGYTTIGEQVGLAQRMESVAPPEERRRSPRHDLDAHAHTCRSLAHLWTHAHSAGHVAKLVVGARKRLALCRMPHTQ
jgi:adenylate cyclase